MQFRVLGPLEVLAHDGPVAMTGQRQRQLLALLLTTANRAVAVDRLIDAVWDEDPPSTARRQVQNSVSALRRLLREPALIAGATDTYRLTLGAHELDVQAFRSYVDSAQRLASAGRAGAAVAELRSGLALWRGPAFAGLPGSALEAARARLDEERRRAFEECLRLELRLGRHAGLIGELTELVAADPLRERLVEHLMVALHRSGRRADALDAYHRLRGRLADEFGLEPGTRLRELHSAILRYEDAPPARRLVPAQLPAGVAGFAGRREHLEELDRLLSGSASATAVATIAGAAGVGKTALAVHWAQRARPHFPDGQLYVNLRGSDSGRPPMPASEVLRGFLDALEVAPARIPAGLAARSALYRSLLAGRRMLVVLDDARDAGQVRPLLPGCRTCVVVITGRDTLSGLIAAEGARPVSLDLLDRAEAYQLLAVRLGPQRLATDPDAVDEIIDRCARLPLALGVAAARAATKPGFPLAAVAAELR